MLFLAYNERKRLDNSILKIQVGMQLLSGDPCYKASLYFNYVGVHKCLTLNLL